MRRFDIAPYAFPSRVPTEVRFEEPRDIATVQVAFRGIPPPVQLHYLRGAWPQHLGGQWPGPQPIERYPFTERPFAFGWYPVDDHYHTTWQQAAIRAAAEGSALTITFLPLAAEEPRAADYDVTFRRTLGIKLERADPQAVEAVRVFTTSEPAASKLRVTLDAGRRTPGATIALRGYNAVIGSVRAGDGASVRRRRVMLSPAEGRSFEVAVSHLRPSHPFCFDDGHVTFVLEDDTFTISLESLRTQGPIWSPEAGVFVTFADDATTFAEYRQRNRGTRTISAMVREHEEQTFAKAVANLPRQHLRDVSFCCGVKYARQGFRVQSYGDVIMDWFNVVRKGEAKDTPRFKNGPREPGHPHWMQGARFFFGLDQWALRACFVDPAPAPVYNVHAGRDGVTVEEKVFAAPLLQSVLAGELPHSDDPVVALVRFRFANSGDTPQHVRLPIRYSQTAGRDRPGWGRGLEAAHRDLDPLRVEGDCILGEFQGESVLRCSYASTMQVEPVERGVQFCQELAPGEQCELVLKIPFIALDTEEELQALAGLDFDRCYREMTGFWQRESRRGARIVTPIPAMNAFFDSHLTHLMTSDFALPDGSGLLQVPAGTSTYASPANESAMITHDLDARGLHEEARRRLGVWLRFQGTAPILGAYTDFEGLLFGAGGFEFSPAYNQDHGWVLWALCEHYLLTRDEAWMQEAAPGIVAAADWAFRQRKNTMQELPYSRGWERGWLPAGALEDVHDTFFWLANNALIWRGTEWAARALEAAGHPEAPRVRREADAFRADLVRGFETQRQHTPLVRLRDGRWAPKYSSRLYLRGRDFGWIREVYEGAMFLLVSGLYDPNGREAEWILDDYQDNLYPQPPYGYHIEDFEENWFARAGFCPQPNYFPDVLPYLDRDEPDIYVWMFLNKWTAVYLPEVGGMAEHPAPVLGSPNAAVYKTSEESGATSWLRLMYVYAKDGLLHFGRALPRSWLADGCDTQATDVATHYGHTGVRYLSEAGSGRIAAHLDLDLRTQPERTLVRFRHPEGAQLQAVTVNGEPWGRFDATKGDVDVTGLRGRVSVVAQYGTT